MRTSRSAPRCAPSWNASTATASRLAASITARRACARTMRQITTPRSCSTPTETTSRRCAWSKTAIRLTRRKTLRPPVGGPVGNPGRTACPSAPLVAAPRSAHVVEELLAVDLAVAHVIETDLAHARAAAALHGGVQRGRDGEPVPGDHRVADGAAVHRFQHVVELAALLEDGIQSLGIAQGAGRCARHFDAHGVLRVQLPLRLLVLALAAQFDQAPGNLFGVHG